MDWEAIIYEKGLDKKGKIKAFTLYKLFGRTQLGVREISVNKIEKDAKIATISCSEPDVLSTEFLYDREEREFLFETPTGSAEAQVDGNKKYSEAREEAKKYFEQAGLFSDMKNNIESKISILVKKVFNDVDWTVEVIYK